MIPIPMISNQFVLTCNSAVSFPTLSSTASLWYKGGPTASVDTAGYNTVVYDGLPDGLAYSYVYEHMGSGKNLINSSGGLGYQRFLYSSSYLPGTFTKNGIPYIATLTDGAAYLAASNTDISSTAGKGTIALVWKTNGSSTNSFYFFAKNSGTVTRGYLISPTYVTIMGDTQTYTFANSTTSTNQWNITIVSVGSAGNPVVYRNNGVQGSITAYTMPLGVGAVPTIGVDSYVGFSFAEFLWWPVGLSSTDCDDLEVYLRQKWCIDF